MIACMHFREYKLESKKNMLTLFKMDSFTYEFGIFFSCLVLNFENVTKKNQAIDYFIYISKDTQYCLIITKSGWLKNDPQNKKNGALSLKFFLINNAVIFHNHIKTTIFYAHKCPNFSKIYHFKNILHH